MVPKYDEPKFKQLLHLVAAAIADHPSAGAVKLNKVLYYAEFGQYRDTGVAISGAEFVHRRMGPTPYRLLPVRSSMIDEGLLKLEVRELGPGMEEHRLSPAGQMTYDLLSPEEISRVRLVAEELRPLSASGVSARSHLDAGWRTTFDGETIPYDAVFMDAPQHITAKTRERLIAAETKLS